MTKMQATITNSKDNWQDVSLRQIHNRVEGCLAGGGEGETPDRCWNHM